MVAGEFVCIPNSVRGEDLGFYTVIRTVFRGGVPDKLSVLSHDVKWGSPR